VRHSAVMTPIVPFVGADPLPITILFFMEKMSPEKAFKPNA
jgi:hypothetical protein